MGYPLLEPLQLQIYRFANVVAGNNNDNKTMKFVQLSSRQGNNTGITHAINFSHGLPFWQNCSTGCQLFFHRCRLFSNVHDIF